MRKTTAVGAKVGRPSRRRRRASSRGGQAMSAFGTTTPADGAMVYTDCSSAVSGPGEPRGGHSQRGRIRSGNRSTWAYSPLFWNGSRPPSPFHSRRRRFAMRHQVVFSTSAFLAVCGRAVVLLVACGDDASKPPNQASVVVGTPLVLEIIAEQAVTAVDRQLQALGLRDCTGPLPRSAWRSARPDRSP